MCDTIELQNSRDTNSEKREQSNLEMTTKCRENLRNFASSNLTQALWSRLGGSRNTDRQDNEFVRFESIDDLIDAHFSAFSDQDHINRAGLTLALRQLGQRPALIVETGSSAWGVDSSRLFASYVSSFGGEFHSVDIRPEASQAIPFLGKNIHFHVGDSVQFLQNFSLPKSFEKIDLLYLDSMDLNPLEPESSMEHGLDEYRASARLLKTNSIVVIDDTPIEPFLLGRAAVEYTKQHGLVPGKGALVRKEFGDSRMAETLYHHYNLVLKVL